MRRPGDRHDVPRDQLEALYQSGISLVVIARALNVSIAVVRHRIERWQLQRAPAPEAVAVKPRRSSVEPVIAPPFWTPDRDAAVIETQGVYADIGKLADRWGVPSRRVVCRWHHLRVMA